MIPYDMESMRQLRATNREVEHFAALEFGKGQRAWASASAQDGERRGRRRTWISAVIAYLSPR